MADTPASETSHYPVVLDLNGRLVVVIAPGPVAERRARTFARYGADVALVTPDPTPALVEAEADGKLTMERRPYVRGDLEGAFLVFCRSGSSEVDAAVVSEAEERGCLVRVPDMPEHSNFSVPSVVRRGALQLAVSTGGLAPVVAKQIRERLAEEFGDEWRRYLDLYAEVRRLAGERFGDDVDALRELLDALAESDVPARMRDGEEFDAGELFDELTRAAGGEDTDVSRTVAPQEDPEPDGGV